METFPTGTSPLSPKALCSQLNLGMSQRPVHGQHYNRHQGTDAFHNREIPSIFRMQNTIKVEPKDLKAMPATHLPSQYLPAAESSTAWSTNFDGIKQEQDDDVFASVAVLQSTMSPDYYQQAHYTHASPGTLEPRMTLRRYGSYSCIDQIPQYVPDLPNTSYVYDSPELDNSPQPYQPAAYQEQRLSPKNEQSPTSSEENLCGPLCKHMTEGEEDTTDKPYAKLIYEALMQAPGHRMMLRDIYGWFVENTMKAQDSSTNGWQNSIRHNLSMNQAFENDKSVPLPIKGTLRKANSVWVLTDHAVKHGVQSTTRYRKTGVVKRVVAGRTPAIPRQKSGARGGRAARRGAARMKKQEEESKVAEVYSYSLADTSPCLQHGTTDHNRSMIDQGSYHEYRRPTTPTEYGHFEPLYALPSMRCAFDTDQVLKSDTSDLFENDVQMHDYLFHQRASPTFEKVSKIETD